MWTYQHTYLIGGGRRDTDSQTATPNRLNDFALTVVATKDETTGARVLFHGATEGRLGLTRQTIDLDQYDRLELGLFGSSFFSGCSSSTDNVLVGSNLFDDVLYDETIVETGVSRTEFNVIIGGDHVDFHSPLGRCGEGALVEFEFLGAGSVQSTQQCVDASAFARTGRPVEEEMRHGLRMRRQGSQTRRNVFMIREIF